MGYVSLGHSPQVPWRQQTLPARLGLGFRILIASVRVTTTRPGGSKPETFFTTVTTEAPRSSGFGFEFPQAQIPGPWVLEAHDGDTLLYRAEFQVLPPDALPGLSCEGPFVF